MSQPLDPQRLMGYHWKDNILSFHLVSCGILCDLFHQTFSQLHGWQSNLITLIGKSLPSQVIRLTHILAKIWTSVPYNCWSVLHNQISVWPKIRELRFDKLVLIWLTRGPWFNSPFFVSPQEHMRVRGERANAKGNKYFAAQMEQHYAATASQYAANQLSNQVSIHSLILV